MVKRDPPDPAGSQPDAPPPTYEHSQSTLSIAPARSILSSAGTARETSRQKGPEETFASFATHSVDRISLVGFSENIINLIRETIQAHWVGGIQNEKGTGLGFEFKIKGIPWSAGAIDDKVKAAKLMCVLYRALATAGWVKEADLGIAKRDPGENARLFRKQSDVPVQCDVICLGFWQGNCIRIINPQQNHLDHLVELFVDALGEKLESEKRNRKDSSYELILTGHPWNGGPIDHLNNRMMLIKLLESLELQGWSLFASEKDHWYLIHSDVTP